MLQAYQIRNLTENYHSAIAQIQKDILLASQNGKKAVLYKFEDFPDLVNLFMDETPDMQSPLKKYFEAFGYRVGTYINLIISWYEYDPSLSVDGKGLPNKNNAFEVISK